MNKFWNNLRMFLWMTFVTGIAYPLLITGIGYLTMKHNANGNFLFSNEKPIGATLIGQKFVNEKYFWGRPSSIDYNPLPSGASNLGPTSADLKKTIDDRKAAIAKVQGKIEASAIPSELLFASGSGLDPHITPKAAHFQVDRIIKARSWDEKKAKPEIEKLIKRLTEKRSLGFLGEPRVNVLKLNLALDKLEIK